MSALKESSPPADPTRVRHVVVIASTGRPAQVGRLVAQLRAEQTVDAQIVLSLASDADAPDGLPDDVRVLVGPRGLPRQRNTALDALDPVDVVTFLDDDIRLAPDFLAATQAVLAADPTLAGVGGTVVADGARTGELTQDEAAVALETLVPQGFLTVDRLYGCAMSYRGDVAGSLRFDPRLALYGWLEDWDFSRRAARTGRLVEAGASRCVHLGISSGRTSGFRYGFSQVVNPVYLGRAGSMTPLEAVRLVAQALVGNLVHAVRPQSRVDYLGRLAGNLRGLADLVRHPAGRPDLIATLDDPAVLRRRAARFRRG